MKTAIAALKEVLEGLGWAKVVTEPTEAGSGYQIALLLSTYSETRTFGAVKKIQGLSLRLTANKNTDPGSVSAKCSEVVAAIVADRRLSGTAHTTLVNDFAVEDNEGREGVVMTAPVEVHVYG